MLVVGFASGTIPKAPANLMLVKNCAVVGLYWGAYLRRDPGVLTGAWRRLLDWYDRGRLRPMSPPSTPWIAAWKRSPSSPSAGEGQGGGPDCALVSCIVNAILERQVHHGL